MRLFAGYIPYYADYIADLMDKKNTFGARCRAIKILTIVKRMGGYYRYCQHGYNSQASRFKTVFFSK